MYAAIAAIAAAMVVLVYGYWLLVPLAALALVPLGGNLYLATRREEMTAGGELLGIAGLALGAPVMYYVAAGAPGVQMLGLWLLSFLYFGGSVFYVKMKVRIHTRQAPPAGLLRVFMPVGRRSFLPHIHAGADTRTGNDGPGAAVGAASLYSCDLQSLPGGTGVAPLGQHQAHRHDRAGAQPDLCAVDRAGVSLRPAVTRPRPSWLSPPTPTGAVAGSARC